MRPVLVVVRDIGPEAEDALALGERLASLQSVPLSVARVLSPSRPPARAGVRARRLEIEQTRRWVRASDVPEPCDVVPVAGPSARQELHALARERHAQLLVVSSEPHSSAGRVRLGRWEASSVVHDAPCAVAAAPSGYRLRTVTGGPIGVAYDGLPESLAALRSAHALAHAAGASLQVLVAPSGTEIAIDEQLAAFDTDVAVERIELPDNAVAGLTHASAALDLLICGSRDRRPLRRLALGRIPLALMRAAACPLVVVPPGAPLAATLHAGR